MPTFCRPARLALSLSVVASSVLGPVSAMASDDDTGHSRPDAVEHLVQEVVESLGISWGTVVNSWDLRDAAEEMGISLQEPRIPFAVARKFDLDVMDLWREIFVNSAARELLHGQRARLLVHAKALGLDPAEVVDDSDVLAMAQILCVDIGSEVDPIDVHRVLLEALRLAVAPTPVMATVGELVLRTPTRELKAMGFHQAPRGETRLTMTPVGRHGFTMASRRRGTAKTSAVDVAMPRDTAVLSPVDGRVVEVRNYALYGNYRDSLVRIRQGNHDVVVLHLQGVKVHAGQRVEGGVTEIAEGPRVFPFKSQVEKFAGHHPHVDVTVRAAR
ncbi:MAG: hypothetical protein ACI867_001956 [Glaciecola sp.]|jgi:hypothetical protein